jgi:23S rRNA pseudouridine2605 synthase
LNAVPSEKPPRTPRAERSERPQRPPRRKSAATRYAEATAVEPQEPAERNARHPRGPRGSRAEPPAESQKLQKVLAQAGLGSRRAMETWIEAGRVSVNGKIAGIGTRVMPADRLLVDGRPVRVESAEAAVRVLIYHKPEGEIVTRDDPEGRETVFTRLPRLRGSRWLSIGRLDVSTSGLLLFTTSGELANTMMHPRFEVEREYAARIFGKLTDEQGKLLLEGVTLEDGIARCESLIDEGGEGSNHWYRLIMTEGRNRVVRRLFEAVGFTVSRLIRVRFGPMQLPPRLKRGQIEELTPADVKQLAAWLEKPVGASGQKPAAKGVKKSRV